MYLHVCTFELQDAVLSCNCLALCTFQEFFNFDGQCLATSIFLKIKYWFGYYLFCIRPFIVKVFPCSPYHHSHYGGLCKFISLLGFYLLCGQKLVYCLPEFPESRQNGLRYAGAVLSVSFSRQHGPARLTTDWREQHSPVSLIKVNLKIWVNIPRWFFFSKGL